MLKNISDFQTKMTDLKAFYAQRNINMLAWRDCYFMRQEPIFLDKNGKYLKAEPDEQRLVLPIAYNLVESFRELLLAKSPSISVPIPSMGGDAFKLADKNEKILLSFWESANVYERLRDAMWHALVDGWGVLQMVWNADNDSCPVEVLHHDPANVYAMPDSSGVGWQYIFHTYTRLVGSIREEWTGIADGRSKLGRTVKAAMERLEFDKLKDTDSVSFSDYWDAKDNAVAISYTPRLLNGNVGEEFSTFIKEPTPHGYGCLPWYVILPCRLPFKNVGERLGVSIMYPLTEIIRYKDVAISQKATMATRYADPPLVTYSEMGEDIDYIRGQAGAHIRMKPGERAEYLIHPGTAPSADVLMQQVDEYIETAGLPRVLQGLYMGSASGVAMSLLRNPTLMRIAFKQKEVEKVLECLNADALRLFEKKLFKTIRLWGLTVNNKQFDVEFTGKDVGGYYRNSVKLSASLPSDDASTVNMLVSLITSGVLSAKTSRDVAQQTLHELVPQSLIDEEQNILIEKALADPGIIQSIAMELAKQNNLQYLQPKQTENPMGGYGEKVPGMPAQTLPSQVPGYPTGNTKPNAAMQLQELAQSSPQMQAGISPSEIPTPVGRSANVGNLTAK